MQHLIRHQNSPASKPVIGLELKCHFMRKNVLRLFVGLSMLASSVVSMPAQAALQGTLQRGQTQSIEATLEPGIYLLYVTAIDAVTKAPVEASFTIYETNGKLLKKSVQLPSSLQMRPRQGVVLDKGAAIEIRRRQTLHFEVRMDVCRMLCGFNVIPVRTESNRIEVVDLPTKVLPKKPSSKPTASTGSKPAETDRKSTNQSRGDRQIYVFQTNSYVDTGMAVNPGDRINIQASGRVRFGVFAGSGGPKGIAFNPDYTLPGYRL